jgi:hypothetical protein
MTELHRLTKEKASCGSSLITQDAPIYLHEFLFRFFRRLQTTHHQIVGVVVESSLTKPLLREAVYRLRLYGPWDFLRTG